ncbi:MAG: hypothetical protein KDK99_02215, partial [Verrucomicrobiales bacterium]|nr:hypothetical protein [Verrucomicrobiales bacterium]
AIFRGQPKHPPKATSSPPKPPLTSSLFFCLPSCGLHSSALASNPTQRLSFFAAFMDQNKPQNQALLTVLLQTYIDEIRDLKRLISSPEWQQIRRLGNPRELSTLRDE